MAEQQNLRKPCGLFMLGYCQCKRGAQCTFRHDGPEKQRRLPHVSCNRAADGTERLCLRPQLNEAWEVATRQTPTVWVRAGELPYIMHGGWAWEEELLDPLHGTDHIVLTERSSPFSPTSSLST